MEAQLKSRNPRERGERSVAEPQPKDLPTNQHESPRRKEIRVPFSKNKLVKIRADSWAKNVAQETKRYRLALQRRCSENETKKQVLFLRDLSVLCG
jgi:hypothetical protein